MQRDEQSMLPNFKSQLALIRNANTAQNASKALTSKNEIVKAACAMVGSTFLVVAAISVSRKRIHVPDNSQQSSNNECFIIKVDSVAPTECE
jgi:hypothetical protein